MYNLSQPIGHFKGDNSPQLPDLRTSIQVEDCLNCNDSYQAHDPLGLCPSSFQNVIANVYMKLKGTLFMCDLDRSDRNKKQLGESKTNILDGLEILKQDFKNKENLYELFFDVWNKNNKGEYYSKDDFYVLLDNFFKYVIKYWETVIIAIDQILFLNDDSEYRNKMMNLQGLLDDMKFADSLDAFKGMLQEYERLPYQTHFRYGGKKTFLKVNGNISTDRMVELERLLLLSVFENREKSRIRKKEHEKYDESARICYEEFGTYPPGYEPQF